MALRAFYEAKEPYVVTDTAEEMAELLKLLRRSGPGIVFPLVQKTTLGHAEAFDKFLSEINTNAKQFLSLLVTFQDGVKGNEFSELLNVPVEKFGGILGGASKIAKKYDLDFKKIVQSEMRVEGSTRFRWLKPGPLLVKNASALLEEAPMKKGA